MANISRFCPDCGTSVEPTMRGYIISHMNPARTHVCAGSFRKIGEAIIGPVIGSSRPEVS